MFMNARGTSAISGRPTGLMRMVVSLLAVGAAGTPGLSALAGSPQAAPAAVAQPTTAMDEALTDALSAHIAKDASSASDYVVGKFRRHDIVFLGEQHLKAPGPVFLQRMIPKLYAAGVRILAYEMAARDDQAVIDRLLSGPEYGEELAFEILSRWDFYWQYQEYADVFRAVWNLNHSLPDGQPRFRIVGIDATPDYRRLPPGMDPSSYEARGLIVGGDRDLVRNVLMADVLQEEVLRRGLKALVYNGGGHSHTRYRRPNRYCPEGPRRIGVGYLIHSQIGDRAFSIMMVAPRRSGEDVVVDMVTAGLPDGRSTGGFDTRHSPVGDLVIRSGDDRVPLKDFYDGYVFVSMDEPWHAVNANLRYVTDERVTRAQALGMLPHDLRITAASVRAEVIGAAARIEEELSAIRNGR